MTKQEAKTLEAIERQCKAANCGCSQWVDVVAQLPKSGKTVLASYLNAASKVRIIRAKFLEPKTIEACMDSDDSCSEYDEATDTYWLQGGWYECIDNWGDYSSVQVCEGDVTHWMPLPDAPGAAPAAPTEDARDAGAISADALASAMHDAAIHYANGHITDFQDIAREFLLKYARDASAQQDEREAWVSVNDSLPPFDSGERVLIYTEGTDFAGEQFFDIKAEDLYPTPDGEQDARTEVAAAATHWMWLPRPARAKQAQADATVGTAVAELEVVGTGAIFLHETEHTRNSFVKGKHALYAHPDPLLAECVEALEIFVAQWNACGPNSDFGRYFANVRTVAVATLAKVQAAKEQAS